jgi:hypothetical protein
MASGQQPLFTSAASHNPSPVCRLNLLSEVGEFIMAQQRPGNRPPHIPAETDPRKGSSNYKDRPSDDGKHGDGAKEPTAAVPGSEKPDGGRTA